MDNTFKRRRNLPDTMLLVSLMIALSPKTDAEIAAQEVAKNFLDNCDDTWLQNCLQSLQDQKLVEVENGNVVLTNYGIKLALQATQDTPNFNRLASSSTSTAFAMLFAGYKALEVHLQDQDNIRPGERGDTLYTNLTAMVEFFSTKLGLNAAPKKAKKS